MEQMDFRSVKERSFLNKEGIHKAIISEVNVEKSSNGNDMWVIKLDTDQGSCTKYIVFTEKAMPFLKRDFRIIGCNVDDELVSSSSLVGKEVLINATRQMEVKKDAFGNIIGEEPSAYLTIDFYEDTKKVTQGEL